MWLEQPRRELQVARELEERKMEHRLCEGGASPIAWDARPETPSQKKVTVSHLGSLVELS